MVDFGLGILLRMLRFGARVLLAIFARLGYFVVLLVETMWYVAHGKTEMVGKALGDFGRDSKLVLRGVEVYYMLDTCVIRRRIRV